MNGHYHDTPPGALQPQSISAITHKIPSNGGAQILLIVGKLKTNAS